LISFSISANFQTCQNNPTNLYRCSSLVHQYHCVLVVAIRSRFTKRLVATWLKHMSNWALSLYAGKEDQYIVISAGHISFPAAW